LYLLFSWKFFSSPMQAYEAWINTINYCFGQWPTPLASRIQPIALWAWVHQKGGSNSQHYINIYFLFFIGVSNPPQCMFFPPKKRFLGTLWSCNLCLKYRESCLVGFWVRWNWARWEC
jgi:hypothetical protein